MKILISLLLCVTIQAKATEFKTLVQVDSPNSVYKFKDGRFISFSPYVDYLNGPDICAAFSAVNEVGQVTKTWNRCNFSYVEMSQDVLVEIAGSRMYGYNSYGEVLWEKPANYMFLEHPKNYKGGALYLRRDVDNDCLVVSIDPLTGNTLGEELIRGSTYKCVTISEYGNVAYYDVGKGEIAIGDHRLEFVNQKFITPPSKWNYSIALLNNGGFVTSSFDRPYGEGFGPCTVNYYKKEPTNGFASLITTHKYDQCRDTPSIRTIYNFVIRRNAMGYYLTDSEGKQLDYGYFSRYEIADNDRFVIYENNVAHVFTQDGALERKFVFTKASWPYKLTHSYTPIDEKRFVFGSGETFVITNETGVIKELLGSAYTFKYLTTFKNGKLLIQLGTKLIEINFNKGFPLGYAGATFGVDIMSKDQAYAALDDGIHLFNAVDGSITNLGYGDSTAFVTLKDKNFLQTGTDGMLRKIDRNGKLLWQIDPKFTPYLDKAIMLEDGSAFVPSLSAEIDIDGNIKPYVLQGNYSELQEINSSTLAIKTSYGRVDFYDRKTMAPLKSYPRPEEFMIYPYFTPVDDSTVLVTSYNSKLLELFNFKTGVIKKIRNKQIIDEAFSTANGIVFLCSKEKGTLCTIKKDKVKEIKELGIPLVGIHHLKANENRSAYTLAFTADSRVLYLDASGNELAPTLKLYNSHTELLKSVSVEDQGYVVKLSRNLSGYARSHVLYGYKELKQDGRFFHFDPMTKDLWGWTTGDSWLKFVDYKE